MPERQPALEPCSHSEQLVAISQLLHVALVQLVTLAGGENPGTAAGELLVDGDQ